MRESLAVLVLVTAFVGNQAIAQDTGFYLGAKAGQSKFKGGCEPTPGITFTSCDDKETAWGVFAGYQFNRYIAVETGWTDLGEITATGRRGIRRRSSCALSLQRCTVIAGLDMRATKSANGTHSPGMMSS